MAAKQVMKATELMNQSQEELDQVQLDRNLEDAKVALKRAIEDKERELRNHKDAEESRVVAFVKDAGQDPNVL